MILCSTSDRLRSNVCHQFPVISATGMKNRAKRSLVALVIVRTEVAMGHILIEPVVAKTIASDIVHLPCGPLPEGLRPFLLANIPIAVMSSRSAQVDLPVGGSPKAKHLPPLRGQLMLGGFRVRHHRDSRKPSANQNMTRKLTGERSLVNR